MMEKMDELGKLDDTFYDSYAKRQSVVPRNKNEFYDILYEVLWSRIERWGNTEDIVHEML
jgi:hypothetical protein